MLVLGRKVGEAVVIEYQGKRIEVEVTEIRPHRVKLGFTAPLEALILRDELLQDTDDEDNHQRSL
jgi:carbon storage regulator CsrA